MADSLTHGPVKILHAADLHLGAPVAVPDCTLSPRANQARGESLFRLVKLAREKKANLVFLGGDIFDSPYPEPAARLTLLKALRQLSSENIRTFIAPGNHDPRTPDSVWENLPVIEGVHIFSTRPEGVALSDLGVFVAGCAHNTFHVTENLAQALPLPPSDLTGLALLHCNPVGIQNQSQEHQPYAPAELSLLRRGDFAFWGLGHWHKPQILCKSPLVLMPGALQGAHKNETGPHGAWLVSLSGQASEAEFSPLSLINHHRLDIILDPGIKNLTDLAWLIREKLPENTSAELSLDCLYLNLFGPSPIWRLFQGEKAAYNKEELKKALDLAGLALDVEGVSPLADLAELESRDDVLAGLLIMLKNIQADPEQAATLAWQIKKRLHPLSCRQENQDIANYISSLLPKVRDLALASLLPSEQEKE